MFDRWSVFPSGDGDENARGYGANSRLMIRARPPDQPALHVMPSRMTGAIIARKESITWFYKPHPISLRRGDRTR
jgi:hypothetical protein